MCREGIPDLFIAGPSCVPPDGPIAPAGYGIRIQPHRLTTAISTLGLAFCHMREALSIAAGHTTHG